MNHFAIGVVEDRHDPKQMGRVRVRVLGLHSPDRKNDIEIESLPWSVVMQPTNASSTSGNISQLVEGTWVIVMYLDQNLQDPIVMGSIPSIYGEVPDFEQGFTDPFGVYPKWTGQSDTSLLGKEDEWLEHPTYDTRKETRLTDIPKAKKYALSSVLPDIETEQRSNWDEKDLRGDTFSQYPYNAVREFEGGMTEEFDSSPEGERITVMHPSGSYKEIIADGSTTMKIMGDGYQITIRNHHMFIRGDLSVSVEGDMRTLVEGDYILEVEGNYHELIRGNKASKIEGNEGKEIGVSQSVSIFEDQATNIGGDQITLIDNNHIFNVIGDSNTTVGENKSLTVGSNNSQIVSGNDRLVAIGNRVVTTQGNHTLETVGNVNIDADGVMVENVGGTIDRTAGGNITVIAPRIDLNP